MREKLQTVYSDDRRLKDPNFEIYYYADNKLNYVQPHKHGYYEFLFFLEGNVTTEIDGCTYKLQPHDMTVVPPGAFHRSRIEGDQTYRRFTFWISEKFFEQLKEQNPEFGWIEEGMKGKQQYCFHLDQMTFQELQSIIFRMIEMRLSSSWGKDAYENLYCAELMLGINKAIHSILNPARVSEGSNLYDHVLSYIKSHIEEDLSLDHLAEIFYVSKYHIAHLFKSHMGMSLHQYVIRLRVERVRNQILQDADITQTCMEAGFKDYSNFYRAFVKEYGMSPKAYKKKHKITPEEYSKDKTTPGARSLPDSSADQPDPKPDSGSE